MSFRFVSEQLADLRHDAQLLIKPTADQEGQLEAFAAERRDALMLLAVEDEDVANQSPTRLLITAATQQGVETLARRIHGAGPRTQFPFVQTWAGELPVDSDLLKEYCARFLDAAAGGSVLVSAVEEMPAIVQDTLIDLLGGLESARLSAPGVRLMSGTTVSLLDRVAAGTFSERLFYRLNIIHLIVGNRSESTLV
jgi:DNA-binding NtrC family response regulator